MQNPIQNNIDLIDFTDVNVRAQRPSVIRMIRVDRIPPPPLNPTSATAALATGVSLLASSGYPSPIASPPCLPQLNPAPPIIQTTNNQEQCPVNSSALTEHLLLETVDNLRDHESLAESDDNCSTDNVQQIDRL